VVNEHLSIPFVKAFVQEVATRDDIAPQRFYDSFSAKSFQKIYRKNSHGVVTSIAFGARIYAPASGGSLVAEGYVSFLFAFNAYIFRAYVVAVKLRTIVSRGPFG
jgi:hypothetical protein